MSLELSSPTCIAPVADLCGEGALWHPEEQAVYWVDINGFRAHRLSLAGKLTTWPFPEPVTALALTTRPDTLVAVLATQILLWQPGTDRRTSFYTLPGAPEVRHNDARVDPSGALWVGTMQNNVGPAGEVLPIDRSIGTFFSLTAAGHARTWLTQLGISNTVVWSPGAEHLYTADTLANKIFRLDWHPGGMVSNETLWFEADPRGAPDGSIIDHEGFLWNCRYGGHAILRIAPDGTVERTIEMPVANPTTCVFGGPEGTTLYVTSAALGDSGHPQAGGLFAIQTNTHGLPENRFRL